MKNRVVPERADLPTRVWYAIYDFEDDPTQANAWRVAYYTKELLRRIDKQGLADELAKPQPLEHTGPQYEARPSNPPAP